MLLAAGGFLEEHTKDVLTILGAVVPITLAVTAVLIAAWQVVQGFAHNNRIDALKEAIRQCAEDNQQHSALIKQNRIYSDLVRDIAVNLAAVDSIQEARLLLLEKGGQCASISASQLAQRKMMLGDEYRRLLDEIALFSRDDAARSQAALALAAGSGDFQSFLLLHEVASMLPEKEGPLIWKAVGIARQRLLEAERRG